MGPFGPEGPVVVGHRGAPRRAPENTAASFAAAAADGATWVELDARRCADGLVVAHDPVTAGGVVLIDRTVADLAALGVEELSGVLAGLPPGLGVDVELKNLPGEPDADDDEALAAQVAPLLVAAAAARPVVATSFNPGTVAAMGEHASGIARGFLSGPGLKPLAALEVAGEVGATVLCPHVDAPGLDGAVAEIRAAGLAVLVWTVDDPARATALAAAGADALCTNDPALLVHALR
jgi:glycerophosphoryl diester phosphodiesterase